MKYPLLLAVAISLLVYSCKKDSSESGIFGKYKVVKYGYWSSGTSGNTYVIDSNRLISVINRGNGKISFVDGATSYELSNDRGYCSTPGPNCYSGDLFDPGSNWNLCVCNFYPDSGTGAINFQVTQPYASGSSGTTWEGYKVK